MSNVQYSAMEYSIAAGDILEITRDSNFLSCLTSTGAFKIRFDDGPETNFEAGLTYQPEFGFKKVSVRNTGDTAIEVEFGFGKGDIKDSRVILSSSQILNSRQLSPDEFTAGPVVSALDANTTMLLPENSLRREVIVVVSATAGGPVYVGGDDAALAGQGVPMLAGQSLTLETAAAVYVRNDTGANVECHVAAIGWSS